MEEARDDAVVSSEAAIVLAAAIGVLGTLLGSFVGPFFQHKHEQWRAKREDQQLLREKAADVFDELDRIVSQSHSANIAALQNLNGEDVKTSPFPDLGRLRMLTTVYFPQTLDIVSKYENERQKLSIELGKKISEQIPKNEPNAIKAINVVMMSKFADAATKFVREMRLALASVAPKIQ